MTEVMVIVNLYRCRELDGSGRMVATHAAACAGDGEAVAWATDVLGRENGERGYELWQAGRLVCVRPSRRSTA